MVARCLMLGFSSRVKNWSNRKILTVSLTLSTLISAQYSIPFYDIKALLQYQYCSLKQAENAPIRLGKTNAVGLFSTLSVLLLLSFVVLKLENHASKKVLPHAGLRRHNIATAKAQIFITITSIVVIPLPALFSEFMLKSIPLELSIQIVPILFFYVTLFLRFFPPFMYITFNKELRIPLPNQLKILAGN
ncbi:hypothetical protein QYM36_008902 [Artemia franciscana]|uniref:Uncharacterized protein n=1 Tax=Artemia franciscana TaxID=6661 RepID=A0AA88I1T5_ARTSF|nr:hypothetical protein QYM36_008902 [Artemia franciscana]